VLPHMQEDAARKMAALLERRWDEGGDKRHTIGTYKLRTGMGFIS